MDVVVAGGGPVGLMLACELRLGGASVVVLERDAEPYRDLKAGFMGQRSIGAPTADAFHRRGLLDRVRKAALFWYEPGQQLDPDTFVGHFAGLPIRADRLDPNDPEAAAYRLGGGIVATLEIERILAGRAADLGVQVRRGTAVTGVRAGAGGVMVTAGRHRIEAGWLVGCDGGRSTVRRLAGFAFPGTDAEYLGRIAMVELADPAPLPLCGWTRTPAGAYTHGPVPGRVHTVEYGPAPADRDTPMTAEEITGSLSRVTGQDVRVTKVHSATRYTDATRQASTYRRGRVLLAGDAAHIHAPAGGQGLNLGIGDAVNLGWKLAATVRGWAPRDLLDTYTTERHPVGAWVQGWSDAQTALGRPDPRTRALRRVFRDLLDTPHGAAYVLKQITGIDRGYDLNGTGPLMGRLAPELTLDDGSTLSGHGTPARALLVSCSAHTRRRARPWADRLTVLAGPSDLLLRPDGHVAWNGGDGLTTALTAWLGAPS